jgi:putative selenate reductase
VVEAIADARRVADDIAFKEGLCKRNDPEKNKRDTDRLRLKKGKLIFCGSPEKESERCLECGVLCENCVDVCPNRANISVHAEGASSPQIIHIDDLCNECGNCSAFCPWTGSPYKDKFTYFSREKDLNESKNSGFFDMGKGRFKVRLEGKVFTSSLDPADKKLPKEIAEMIKAARKSIPI